VKIKASRPVLLDMDYDLSMSRSNCLGSRYRAKLAVGMYAVEPRVKLHRLTIVSARRYKMNKELTKSCPKLNNKNPAPIVFEVNFNTLVKLLKT
jgi:hypothetical protein